MDEEEKITDYLKLIQKSNLKTSNLTLNLYLSKKQSKAIFGWVPVTWQATVT